MANTQTVTITGSVGRDGQNHRDDVLEIQKRLNDHLSPGVAALALDGICGPRTIAAIEAAQRQRLGTHQPDGRIDPAGPTWRSLSHDETERHRVREIPPLVVAAAQNAQLAWRVPASVTLAQWVIESGRGRHEPPGSHNPFGIKAEAGRPFVEARTTEVVDGVPVSTTARFRAFTSVDEAFSEHGRLLAEGSAYGEARRHANDPDAFAHALTGHYATDTRYGSKLVAAMKADDLYRYNRPAHVGREADVPFDAAAYWRGLAAKGAAARGHTGEAVARVQAARSGLS